MLIKKRHFDVGTDGFYGAYWKCKKDSDCAMYVKDNAPGWLWNLHETGISE